MNRFYEGQKVVCINDHFPLKATTAKEKLVGSTAQIHPVKGETLTIDEMMGDEWLNFKKYDNAENCNWWHITRFRPIDEITIEANSLIEELNVERTVTTEA